MLKSYNFLLNKFWVFLILFILGFIVFGNGLGGDFVHDDQIVLSHSFFSQPSRIFYFFGQSYFENFAQAGLYRPLTQFSFGLNFLIGASPFGFHLVNLLIHIINSFLVYLFLKRFTEKIRFSAIVALFFLILPIHVEAVASIIGRAELLSFLFGMLTLLLWFDSKYLFSTITLFLALLSKESAVAVIALVFLLSWHYRRNWRWLFYYLGVTVFYFMLRVVVLGQYAFHTNVEFVFNPLAHIPFYQQVFTALKVLVLYLEKIFVPFRLSADYSYDQIPLVKNIFSSPGALIGVAILGLMLWAIYQTLWGNRKSMFTWALAFFTFPYFIISNLVLPIGTIMGDRLMYFPSLGVLMFLILAVKRLFKFSRLAGLIVMLALGVIYSLITINQNRIWASSETLLTANFKNSPNSVTAKTEYGILMLESNGELAKKLSLEVYDKYPDYIQNLNLRAAVEVQEGDLLEAGKFLERALELRPKHQNTLQNLSRVYFTLGKYQETEEVLNVLVSEYDGKGNVIFYALTQVKNRKFLEARQAIYNFFGPDVSDESALVILKFIGWQIGDQRIGSFSQVEKEFRELENFFTFYK